jgi:hypothetical protein
VREVWPGTACRTASIDPASSASSSWSPSRLTISWCTGVAAEGEEPDDRGELGDAGPT